MIATAINPFPPIILHCAIVVLAAAVLSTRIHNRHAAVVASVLFALLASIGWRYLGIAFYAAWHNLLIEPVFHAKVLGSGEKLIGFITFWVFPIAFAYLATFIFGPRAADNKG